MSKEIIDYGFGVIETRETYYTEQSVNELKQRIADLEAKLAESEKELQKYKIDEFGDAVCDFAYGEMTKTQLWKSIEEQHKMNMVLKQQLAEKEKELHYKTAECEKWKADYENCSKLEKMMTKERQYCLDNWRASEQDKIELLEKVESYIKDSTYIKEPDYTNVCEYIRTLIKEIKGE